MTHTFENCSHRPDYASAAEHDRDCPIMEYEREMDGLTPIMNGWRPFDDDGGAYGESLGGQ